MRARVPKEENDLEASKVASVFEDADTSRNWSTPKDVSITGVTDAETLDHSSSGNVGFGSSGVLQATGDEVGNWGDVDTAHYVIGAKVFLAGRLSLCYATLHWHDSRALNAGFPRGTFL